MCVACYRAFNFESRQLLDWWRLPGNGEAVVLAVLVVPLDVEVGEVDGDPPLGRRYDLPDTVLMQTNINIDGLDHTNSR